ncbi:GNAT family N-acetyltransferase [Paucibacter sp. APW11]|uniref:GNAT family N-acetyltransferase n=1 Tax=Roseateles aquae TaxID=3077235 RepID=A0ABU3PF48_9BURK|nr:GNAT family N-acetyltransferase [Paucibacter sp. APW11]MDT9000541.1 GNAT family N-acetyltransferase [Paucibacter sp. APW11]
MSAELAELRLPTGWQWRRLGDQDAPALQQFFDANPEYFLRVGDEGPTADEAVQELASLPPPELRYREHWSLGFEQQGRMQALAVLDAGLQHDEVWHIGLFIVATSLHGQGVAAQLYQSLEDWAAAEGARWMRLGVVAGYEQAERFWRGRGFVEVRQRHAITMGKRLNSVRVMIKPLGEQGIEQYLSLVPRDRPE